MPLAIEINHKYTAVREDDGWRLIDEHGNPATPDTYPRLADATEAAGELG